MTREPPRKPFKKTSLSPNPIVLSDIRLQTSQTMSEPTMSGWWCACDKCYRHNGVGKVTSRSTWYTHNPGRKKGGQDTEWRGHTNAHHARRNELMQGDPSGFGPSVNRRKRPAEEDISPPNRVRQTGGLNSVCLYHKSYRFVMLSVSNL